MVKVGEHESGKIYRVGRGTWLGQDKLPQNCKFILLLGWHRWLAERIPLHYPRLCCLHQCQCCHFPSTFTCFDIFLLWSASITNSPSQGGILGVAGKFPPAYMGAVFAGQVCKDILFFFLSFFWSSVRPAGSWWHFCKWHQCGGAGDGRLGHGRCLLLLCNQVMLNSFFRTFKIWENIEKKLQVDFYCKIVI